MDKFADIKQLFVRYHFWVLCGIVAAVGMIAWYLAYSQLDSEFSTNKAAIDNAANALKAPLDIKPHPNTDFHKGMDVLIKMRREDLEVAWKTMYEKQRETTLIWPKELGTELINEVKRVLGDLPIEQVEIKPETEIPRRYRANYRNYIDEELKKLAAEIGTVWARGQVGAAAGGVEGPADPMAKKLVDWASKDQQRIKDSRFLWPKPNDSEGIPDTRQLLYAQEDLWVLQTLVGVIKRTNGDADAAHKCVVRGIEDLLFGQDVGSRVGKVGRLAVPVAELAPGQQPAAVVIAPQEGRGPMGQPGAAASGPDPANKRYVNLKYEPMTSEDLATATKSSDTATAYLAVAKLMPIRMRLLMDTRKIQKLIAECGNSPLPIEIRQVRINCDRVEPGAAGGGNAAVFGGGGHGREGGGMVQPPREQPRNPNQQMGNEQTQKSEYDATVELYGIIHIFNPVNDKKLGYTPEELAAKNAAAGTTPTATAPGGAKPATTPMGTTPVAPMPPAGVAPMPTPPAGVAPMPPAGVAPAVPMPPAGVAPMPPAGVAPVVPMPMPAVPPAAPVVPPAAAPPAGK